LNIPASGQTYDMKHMPSPTVAERNQRRKLQYLPPVWPLIAIVVVVVGIVALVKH
jgi:hypothetical protein